ncbi:MAG TPA: TlpA disulfide reductase family protein [Bryobacteraceae bacterium]|nr:TlpA disulfide reductase family protein [Bryobacteraceae bacterium]
MKLLSLLAVLPLLLTAQPDPAYEAYQAWQQQHRTSDYKALYEASTEWTTKWPDSRFAWQQRRDSLLQTQNRSAELWKVVDENLIRLSPQHTYASLAAYDWVTYGINLKEAEALISAEIAWQEARPKPAAAADATLADRIDEAGFSSRLFDPLCTLARAEIQLKEFDRARIAIQRIHSWLEGDFKHYYDPDPLETFPDYGSKYFTISAELAEAEGRKADALAFYRRVITDPYYRREYRGYLKQTRTLWDEMGGTPEGWKVFSEVPPLPAGVPAGHLGTSFFPWVALDYKLPPLEGAHFEGKTTLVYLWTSSCAPCWATLPAIQTVHNTVKNRNDLQVITLNVDDDKERSEAFMRQKGYDFPVVIGKTYAKKVLPEMIIGQIWIVDAGGAVRLQRTGNTFNGREQALVDETIYKMSQVSRSVRGAEIR